MPPKKRKSKKKTPSLGPNATGAQKQVNGGDDLSSFWKVSEECAYYAKLGCHIANISSGNNLMPQSSPKHKMTSLTCSQYKEMYRRTMKSYQWLLGIERFDPSEYHPEDLQCIPEIGLDDGEEDDDEEERCRTLTLTNIKDVTNICFVSVWDVDLCGGNGELLQSGWNQSSEGADGGSIKRRKCTTFIVLCPPRTFVHLCFLAPNQFILTKNNDRVPLTSWSQVEIENDIQPWSCHENVNDEHSTLINFPFRGMTDASDDASTNQRHIYQCIQSENGLLTHFFHGNYHAVDFACPVGTPLYSPVNGTVVNVHYGSEETKEGVEVSGIAATNLFHWNSIMIRADDTPTSSSSNDQLFIEYVHIQSKSCVVQTGEHVTKGQLLCKSGSVGFSPTPHLHLGAYRSGEDGAASVRVRFECAGMDGDSFLPVAGGWYDQNGLVLGKKE